MTEKFQSDFKGYHDIKMAVYGMGNNAKAVLQNVENFSVVCVIVQKPDIDSFCGFPVVSIERAFSLGVEIILIAAEVDIEVLIYHRIKLFCMEHHIRIMGLHLGDIDRVFSEHHIYGYVKRDEITEDLMHTLIDSHDVITFDIFDTLICRGTLTPKDVFRIVEHRASLEGLGVRKFAVERVHSEAICQQSNPSIVEIYQEIGAELSIHNDVIKRIMDIELETERKIAHRREGIYRLYQYALNKGKKVYLISDMYLSSEYLRQLLDMLGIKDYKGIFVSNEYRALKSAGLYDIFLKKTGASNIFHIGDNHKSDGIHAVISGFDAAVIPAPIEIMRESNFGNVLSIAFSLNERSMTGMIVRRFFGDPFGHSMRISSAVDYGYLLLGPIITAFMLWLTGQIKEKGSKRVLFAARDGYLFSKLYESLRNTFKELNLPEGDYFYTSRKACFRAYCRDESSLYELMQQYTFTLDDVRRNFTEDGSVPQFTNEDIFSRAEEEYRGYQKYIDSLSLARSEKVAFVDLVSGGTCQYFLEKMFLNDVEGMYLCQVVGTVRRIPRIFSMLSEYPDDPTNFFSDIAQLTLLEAVMTSPEPSLAGFAKHGEPVFLDKPVLEENLKFISEVQEGITEFFTEFINTLYVPGETIHPALLKEILSLRKNLKVSKEILSYIHLEDELLNISFGKDDSR